MIILYTLKYDFIFQSTRIKLLCKFFIINRIRLDINVFANA